MLDISVCPQNVCGSVLSYMLAFSYIHVTIMLLYLNIIVSGMHASLRSLFAACKIWFYSHLQCPDRCKLLFRCSSLHPWMDGLNSFSAKYFLLFHTVAVV